MNGLGEEGEDLDPKGWIKVTSWASIDFQLLSFNLGKGELGAELYSGLIFLTVQGSLLAGIRELYRFQGLNSSGLACKASTLPVFLSNTHSFNYLESNDRETGTLRPRLRVCQLPLPPGHLAPDSRRERPHKRMNPWFTGD